MAKKAELQRALPKSTWLAAIAPALLAGCVSQGPTPVDVEKVKTVNQASLPLLQDRVIEESKKLAEQNQQLRERIEQLRERPPVKPVAPKFNPLDAVNISLDMDNADARNIFQAIARHAGLSLILPRSLHEEPRTLTLSLANLPASRALQHVLETLDMSGKVENNVIVIRDLEEATYNLDFLNTTTGADFSAGGDVFGANAVGSGTGSTSGSATAASNTGLQSNFTLKGRNGDIDHFDQIERMLNMVVGASTAGLAREEGGKLVAHQGRSGDRQPGFVINRSSGTVYVRARPSQVAAASGLIENYRATMSRQVLIEAQIVDIELNDAFRFGVDWSLVRNRVATRYGEGGMTLGQVTSQIPGGTLGSRGVIIPATVLGQSGSNSLGFAWGSSRGSIAIDALREFGTLHVLSNPSLRVKNMQPAVVSVGSNERYIQQLTSNVSQAGGGQVSTSASVTTANVFDGVVMGVIPYVDEQGVISLVINPMQTQVDAESMVLRDVGTSATPMKISLPKVDFKGLTTSLSLRDGDLVVVGGLISERGNNGKHGLPGLADVPFLGNILGGTNQSSNARELVLVLRVSVL